MATRVLSTPAECDTLAHYKAVFQEIGAALTAFGWVQTADTGQVNWGTIATVPTAGTVRDYEIWRPATQSGLTAFYVRFDYSANTLGVTLGRSTDGAGNLGSATNKYPISWTAVATNGNLRTAGGAQWFTAGFWTNEVTTPMVLTIERTHDNGGADNDVAVTVFTVDNNVGAKFVALTSGGALWPELANTAIPIGLPARQSSGIFGSNLGLAPLWPWDGKPENPGLSGAIGYRADLAADAAVTLAVYGVNHTFTTCRWTINTTFCAAIANASAQNAAAYLFRYE